MLVIPGKVEQASVWHEIIGAPGAAVRLCALTAGEYQQARLGAWMADDDMEMRSAGIVRATFKRCIVEIRGIKLADGKVPADGGELYDALLNSHMRFNQYLDDIYEAIMDASLFQGDELGNSEGPRLSSLPTMKKANGPEHGNANSAEAKQTMDSTRKQ